MATWAELRTQVFLNLDLPVNTTGDIKTGVETALQATLEEMVSDFNPRELLVKTAPVSLTSATTSVPLGAGGFEVTDLAEIYGIAVDPNPADSEVEEEFWEEVSYLTYKRQLSALRGDTRGGYQWTFDNNDNFRFTTLPTVSDTWDAYLFYYKTIAAFSDDETPEIASPHHRTIALGATTYYPQMFSGAREGLFQKFQREYNLGRNRFQTEQRSQIATKRIKSRRMRRIRGAIRWE